MDAFGLSLLAQYITYGFFTYGQRRMSLQYHCSKHVYTTSNTESAINFSLLLYMWDIRHPVLELCLGLTTILLLTYGPPYFSPS